MVLAARAVWTTLSHMRKELPYLLAVGAAVAAIGASTAVTDGVEPAVGKSGCGKGRLDNYELKARKSGQVFGYVHMTSKKWQRAGKTCHTSLAGWLHDTKGDGYSVKLWAHTNGPSKAWVVVAATRGRTTYFSPAGQNANAYADRAFVQICAYNLSGKGSSSRPLACSEKR